MKITQNRRDWILITILFGGAASAIIGTLWTFGPRISMIAVGIVMFIIGVIGLCAIDSD